MGKGKDLKPRKMHQNSLNNLNIGPKGNQFARGNNKALNNAGTNKDKLPDFIQAGINVLSNPSTATYLTESEFIFLVNQNLPPQKRIDAGTFSQWKKRARELELDPTIIGEFVDFYKLVIINQKMNLFDQMDDNPRWQQKAWIIERKWREWNQKHQLEVTGANGGPVTIGWATEPIKEPSSKELTEPSNVIDVTPDEPTDELDTAS